jgi:hypothetical protein
MDNITAILAAHGASLLRVPAQGAARLPWPLPTHRIQLGALAPRPGTELAPGRPGRSVSPPRSGATQVRRCRPGKQVRIGRGAGRRRRVAVWTDEAAAAQREPPGPGLLRLPGRLPAGPPGRPGPPVPGLPARHWPRCTCGGPGDAGITGLTEALIVIVLACHRFVLAGWPAPGARSFCETGSCPRRRGENGENGENGRVDHGGPVQAEVRDCRPGGGRRRQRRRSASSPRTATEPDRRNSLFRLCGRKLTWVSEPRLHFCVRMRRHEFPR